MPIFFSIVVPTLNEEHFLPLLLESLTRQSYTNFEVIVVDGQSTDKTIEIASSFTPRNFSMQIIKAQESGLSKQRNIGASVAKGTWLLFVDADSILFPYTLARLEEECNKQGTELLTTWFSSDGTTVQDALIALLGSMMVEASILFHRAFTPGPFTAVTKKRFEEAGGFTESMKFQEDYDFGQKLQKIGVPLHIIRETLYIFSQRRLRREGKLKIINKNIQAALYVLLTKRSLKYMPGYVLGGHLYNDSGKKESKSMFKLFQQRVRRLIESME